MSNQWLKDAVFYEIYPQTFYDTNADGIGDLNGIVEKLDYIKSLGCNALWINPCFDSPFRDAGYDVRDYKKVAPRYGTNNDLYALKEVSLPKSLVEIGENAFSECRSLASVTLPAGVTTLGGGAFDRCGKLTAIALPDSVTNLPASPFTDCRALEEIAVSQDHPSLYVVDGALYDRSEARLIFCPYVRAEGTFIVPEQTRRIGAGAFQNCDQLTGVALPLGIEAIDDHAFSGCRHLAAVELPAGMTAIGNAAFSECRGLKSVNIPEGVTRIGYLAFYECDGLEDIVLPASVIEIGKGAFIGCRELTVTVAPGSCREEYCKNNGIAYRYAET